jgi:predicted permease
LLIRGPDAELVREDVEASYERDVARGLSAFQARGRWAVNVVASTLSLMTARVRRPRAAFSLVDVRLGIRMLSKYPGLTVIGGAAMAFAIWTGAVTFEVVSQTVHPDLPLPGGDRIVGVQNLDLEAVRPTTPFLSDFEAWRTVVGSLVDLGAFRTVSRNLLVDGVASEPVLAAEMSAAGFRVAGIAPALGRPLFDADEEAGAAPVIVLGHDTWQTRLGGDPGVIGRTVVVGGVASAVVGVMPRGFAFPVSHDVWIPLRRPTMDTGPGEGGRVAVFGRLAPGQSAESAQAELDAIGARRSAAHPEILGRIRPSVVAYAQSVRPLPDIGAAGLMAANAFMVMLLVLVCGNVALLMFARAVSRESELVVRWALGATRARIAGQLFAEALVLGGLAALVGLLAANAGVRWFIAMQQADSGGRNPFWFEGGIAPDTILYVAGLTLLGAAVAGIVPALKVTDGRVGVRLKQAGSSGGVRFGGVWTAVIVAQVAVTLAFPATSFYFQRYVTQMRSVDLGFAASEFLTARIELDETPVAERSATAESAPAAARLDVVWRELALLLASETGVSGVTPADRLPGMLHEQRWIEVEAIGNEDGAPFRVGSARVDTDFLDVIGSTVRAGRGFQVGDAVSAAGPVLVNDGFVERVLNGRSAVGRRIRYAATDDGQPGPWFEIVGVTANLGMLGGSGDPPGSEPGFYRLLARGEASPLHIAVHVTGDPLAFVPRLRAMAATIDPALRVHDVRRMDRVSASLWTESAFLFRLLAGISVIALVLSLSGIYSAMAFAVASRTREIGVRVALGSSRRSVIATVFRRPLVQVIGGTAVGAVLVFGISRGLLGPLTPGELWLVSLYAILMFGVCMLACIVPTRRVLAIEPTEALRADA